MAKKEPEQLLPLPSEVSGCASCLILPQLAQAARFRAGTRASGSGGGPWTDHPSDTLVPAFSDPSGLPSVGACGACGPSSSGPLSLCLSLW